MSDGSNPIDDHFFVRAVEHEFETAPATAGEKEFWEKTLDLVRQDAVRSNGEAVLIMHDYNATGRPFALFLRSFEAESYVYLTPEGSVSDERKSVTTLAGPSRVEQKLAKALAGRLSLIAVANPSQLLTHRGIIPRLQLPNEGWQAVVQNLVKHAHLMVIDCDSLSSGVLWELGTIQAANRQDATVVVLPSRQEADQGASVLTDVAEIFGAAVVKREAPAQGMAELSAFRRVAYEDEIPFDQIDASSLFADLLSSAEALAATAPPFNPAEYARELNNTGVMRFNEKRYAEALDLYQQALVIRRHINDRSGLVTTLFNLGSVYVDAGQPADALPVYTEGLELSRELALPENEGMLASCIGLVHKQLGHFAEARQWFVEAFRVQRDHAAPADVENTLNQLADLCLATNDGDGAVTCFKELRAFHRSKGDRAGELRANMNLGALYYSAGHVEAAVQLFKEGARLSRELGDQEQEATCVAMLERLQANAH